MNAPRKAYPNERKPTPYLFIDTETTGFPNKSPFSDPSQPRIVQIAVGLYEEGGKAADEWAALIRPEGWSIPPDSFIAKHGIPHERALEHGLPLDAVLAMLEVNSNRAKYVIAHNIKFDLRMLQIAYAQAQRHPMPLTNLFPFCTMVGLTHVTRLPGKYGTYKWPSLTELHVAVCGEDFPGAHDALVDVRACSRIFFEAKAKGLFTLPTLAP
jgi:DNA polymerase III epsilon subunit-like protein